MDLIWVVIISVGFSTAINITFMWQWATKIIDVASELDHSIIESVGKRLAKREVKNIEINEHVNHEMTNK